MNLAFISHQSCREHQMGAHHPECPERLHAIQDRMIASGMEMLVTHYDAPQAKVEDLARVHDRDYIQGIFDAAPRASDVLTWIDGDTAMNCHSLEAALHSAGAALLGVDLVMSDKHHAAFCCVRPPGHHAGRARASGFCIFNNVAVGAAYALDHYGLERIAIVDFDVHHGDGTEEIFIGDERVLFCSSFQHPFYPGTGADTDAPNVINLPLPKLTDGQAFKASVEQAWLPRLDAFAPQLIMISAGFDGHIEDDMAHFNLREADYAWITREIHHLARKHSHERVVSFLEGGYTLSALGRCVSTHVDELIGHL
ncbi:histone deacetylase family protein [Thiorhodococcus mannitoliphagus]|uniref:Histone deacetylase family protein n=1 Tax=Thiorhodococcus mannitoliphagus TaxID=329406 RepID=A0A6P1DPA8_9GAMM|nr:histone deacetylase family protein [Thiorhodococcus mannitoliphagus]NEX20107.1 histone deacetylase family protein [Thiorhodococcus mannitoliphagus]